MPQAGPVEVNPPTDCIPPKVKQYESHFEYGFAEQFKASALQQKYWDKKMDRYNYALGLLNKQQFEKAKEILEELLKRILSV